MKRISYAGESVLTSDDVARALIELTAALTTKGVAEVIEIPILAEPPADSAAEDGFSSAAFVVGRGTPMLAVPEGGHGAEPDFSRSVDELTRRLGTVSPARSVAVPAARLDLDLPFEELDLDLGDPNVDPA
ncbi:hypothetical protein [Herbiconiux solani]|uniref:hypothetical protein n=1 Tax=Herbiconiux solani TaxID=661329 RepID=UPI0008255799|nr:hypothetical protein [Herbiconiux solani]